MNLTQRLFSAIILSTALTVSAEASLILSYDTSGNLSSTTTTSGTAPDAGITPLDLIRSADLGAASGAGAFNSNGWGTDAAANPVDDTKYFEFGFTVGALTTVDVTELLISSRSSNTGPGTLGLFSSHDNFVTNLHTFNQGGNTDLDSTISITGITGVTNTTLNFRIIEIGNTQADGNGTTSNGGTFRLFNFEDDSNKPIQLNGTITTVPEPSSIVLLSLAAAGLFLWRRRTTKS